MRILHVIPYISPVFGGPPQVIKAMVQASIISGHDVIVLSTTAGLNEKIDGEGGLNILNSKTYKLFPISSLRNWFYSKPLNDELKNLVGNIDLVHLHIPFTAPFFFAAKWARKNNIPYVITTHGLLDVWSMNHKKIKKWIYFLLFEKLTFKKALKIHVTSTFEKNQVERLCLGVPLKIIPLPVVAEKKVHNLVFSDEDVPDSKDSVAHILFVGRLHPVKGITYLLKALDILRNRGINFILDLGGSGDKMYLEFLGKKIQEYDLQRFIVFHEHVNERQKKILYKKASVFVLPSLHENFGLAAAEAMAAGVPVVVTDQVGLAKDIAEFRAGIVVPASDSELLANAIQSILKIDKISMSLAAINLVGSEYSLIKFTDRLNVFYAK